MKKSLTILGIESSCDDTAAAVVRRGEEGAEVLASVVFGQTALHEAYGGVVPEIAARISSFDSPVSIAMMPSGASIKV